MHNVKFVHCLFAWPTALRDRSYEANDKPINEPTNLGDCLNTHTHYLKLSGQTPRTYMTQKNVFRSHMIATQWNYRLHHVDGRYRLCVFIRAWQNYLLNLFLSSNNFSNNYTYRIWGNSNAVYNLLRSAHTTFEHTTLLGLKTFSLAAS